MGARSRRGRIRPSSHLEHEEELNENNRRRDRDRVARRPLESGRQGLGRGVDGNLGDDLLFPPWLDRSPVKSIRYKGPITKTALTLFVIVFFVLGYLGTESVTEGRTLAAQVGTAVYFLFFFLMPWYSKMDTTRPEPQ